MTSFLFFFLSHYSLNPSPPMKFLLFCLVLLGPYDQEIVWNLFNNLSKPRVGRWGQQCEWLEGRDDPHRSSSIVRFRPDIYAFQCP